MTETNKKKKVALVFGITKDYTFALANVLIGLVKHNKKFWDDIIVYHDGMPEYDQASINRIAEVKFIDLSTSEHFEKIAQANIETIEKYSIATFYRFECLKLLDEYHQVIWNDVDIMIRGDISGLMNYGEESGVAFSMALSDFVVGSSFSKLNFDYEMFRRLWNVGIMVLTDKLDNYEKIYEWCIDATVKYQDILLWPDLAVLNLMLQEYNIEPENIDRDKYVCLPTAEQADDALILHAYGDKKFWNDLDYMKDYPEWMENAIKWSRMAYANAKDNTPLVSCVMSCYERYDYLKESIDSVLAQSYPNFEIIVVLEASKNQKEIADFLMQYKEPRIRIIKNEKRLGFAESLNVGIDKAKGDYVARLDDDDIAMARRFAIQVDYLEQHRDVGIVGGNMVVFGHNKGKFLTFSDYEMIKVATLFGTPFMHPTVMMRKDMLDKYGLRYDPDYFTEDYELWSRAVYCFKCANIPEYLTFYRSHSSQATSDNNDAKIHNSHKAIMRKQLKKYLDLDLNENEIETIQVRRDCLSKVTDAEGAFALRNVTMNKVITANKERGVYNEEDLWYVINWGKPSEVDGGACGEIPIASKTKKGIKKIIKSVINPVYGRLVGKMEAMMMNHDEELRLDLQRQIDSVKQE